MSGWVSFDEDGDSPSFKSVSISKENGNHMKTSEISATKSQDWVKFEGSPRPSPAAASSTPLAAAPGPGYSASDTRRPVVPQHTGGSVYSTSDDHHSVVASSVVSSSRGSFSSCHDISSSREYMPLESSSPKPGSLASSSEGWVRFSGDSKRIHSSTPSKVSSPIKVTSQNGLSETARVTSPIPANWIQFNEANEGNSWMPSRPSPASSSQANSVSAESRVRDHVLHSSVAVQKERTQSAEYEPLDTKIQREPLQMQKQVNTEKQLSRTTPLHMTDQANDMEVSILSAVGATSASKYDTTSPGNPFKEEVLSLKQLEQTKSVDEQVTGTVSPYNPFIQAAPSPLQKIPGKINNNNGTWTTFDETDSAAPPQTVPSPGNPFAEMSSNVNVHVPTTSEIGQPYNLFPQGNVNVASSAEQSSIKHVAPTQPWSESSSVQMGEQRTAALLTSDITTQSASSFTMQQNHWSKQQQHIPTSTQSDYPQAVAAVVEQKSAPEKSKSHPKTRPSISSNTPSAKDYPISLFEDQYPREHIDLSEGWSLKLRYPDKKKIAGSRYWQPVHVRLAEGNILQLFTDRTQPDPFRELPLQCNYELGLSHLQQFDVTGKVHTIKLLYMSYKEKWRVGGKSHYIKELHHVELLKLGSLDYDVFRSFVYTVNDALMKLTLYLDRGAHYQQNFITVGISDECRCLVDTKSDVIKQSITVSVNILAFLSGSPDCAIGLNDVRVKGLDVVARQHIIPNKTADWIKLHDVELHKCANKNVFVDSRMIEFQPLNACQFRLMQFHVQPPEDQDLPLEVKATLSGEGTHMELRVDLLIPACSGRKNPAHYMCEDIRVYIPIPDKWISYFRKPKRAGQSSIHAVNKKADAIKRGCLLPKLLEISVGSAKYEHAFRGVVWRIDRLPERATGHPSTHLLKGHLNLTSTKEVPQTMPRSVDVEFKTAHTTASKTTVRSLAVSTEKSPEKRIRYTASYEYKVLIEENYTRITESERDQVSCFQQ